MFNVNYDKTLSLMLAGSKSKRERIIEFLKEIPLELLNQMYKSFDEYQEYLDRNKNISLMDKEIINFSGKFITNGEMVYWYNIESWSGTLDLGKCICYMGDEINVFQMTIYPYNQQDYNNMKIGDDNALGEILYNFVEDVIDDKLCMVDRDSMDFTLIKKTLGNVVMAREYSDGIRRRYNLVNMKNIPDILDVNKLDQNRLVRSRKK